MGCSGLPGARGAVDRGFSVAGHGFDSILPHGGPARRMRGKRGGVGPWYRAFIPALPDRPATTR